MTAADASAPPAPLKEFQLEDVAKHNTVDDCWLIIRDEGIRKVYDVTAFLDDHPGGPEIVIDLAGRDATDEFEDIGHSNDARAQLKDFLVGKIAGDTPQTSAGPSAAAKSTASAINTDTASGNPTPFIAVSVVVAAIALYLKFAN